ncbi:transcriptional regulator [Streptomyces sp. WMMB303]|uniref:transcriptional regulator n=1 Tax=Streptomyces sp. WMMB303 TaxID=3034154 RepID=UPI0023ED6A60|nr:transcriptional regulator [Streptomyces sp. WMMB303]MDF4254710.1 transcriptional regulator [Streptomyces sp. WMMB303]
MTDTSPAAVFAAVFVALYIGHSLGDHWVQSSCQAASKGQPGWKGRLACARHVLGLTATKGAVLAPVVLALELPLAPVGLVVGLSLDAASHYWADRRTTLARLASRCGTPDHPAAPATAAGKPAAHLGTGAYALDQSWHTLWLGITALTITAI